jgi:hypothetical protein
VVTAPKSGGVGVVVGLVVVAVALVAAIVIVTSGPGHGPSPAPPSEVAEVTPPEVPRQPAVPEPEVAKVPAVPDSEPVVPPETVTQAEPEPEPEPEPVVVKNEPEVPMPVFDVPGFLDKGREITRKRAEPALAEHAAALAKNLDAYDRRMKREIRDLPGFMKETAETRNQDNVSGWRESGNRMPPRLPLPGGDDRWGRWGGMGQSVGKLSAVHEESYAKQVEIDRKLETTMRQVADSVYILGLTKQIERLLPDPNEVPSVKLIEAEIAAVKADIRYFIALMQGMTTEQAKAAAGRILDQPDDDDEPADGGDADGGDADGGG